MSSNSKWRPRAAARTLRLFSFLIPLALAAPGALAAPQWPNPDPPAENPITAEKAILGKILFWDEQLSSDNTVACGTCHIPSAGMSDPRERTHPGLDSVFGNDDDVIGSAGVVRSAADGSYEPSASFGLETQVTGRNSPPVIGSQWGSDLFWDGRAAGEFRDPVTDVVLIANKGGLENQVIGPPLSDVEMAHAGRDWNDVVTRLAVAEPLWLATNLPADIVTALAAGADYPALFNTAFGTPEISAARIAFAIATYERTLIPDQSPYDLWIAGDATAMTALEIQGHTMLRDHTVCFNCHVPPLFTDNLFYNIGLRPADEDLGRFTETGNPDDRGRFKTPTLRNVGLRSTMMHVGWINSIQDAIDYYNAPAWPMVDPITGHTQYTADQSGIPTSGPFLANYQDIMMPDFMFASVNAFLGSALTDPRVAAETYPFDRPTLNSERTPTNPELLTGYEVTGSGGATPRMVALDPPKLGSSEFRLGVWQGLGGANAFLVYSLGGPPGSGTGGGGWGAWSSISLRAPVVLSGSGAGAGYGTYRRSLPSISALIGTELWMQWWVQDAGATGSFAKSEVAHVTLF